MDMNWQSILVILGIIVGLYVVYQIVSRIVKFAVTLVIMTVIAAVAIGWCVHAGYLSKESVDKYNPVSGERVREAAGKVGAWAESRAKSAVKKAIREAVTEEDEETK